MSAAATTAPAADALLAVMDAANRAFSAASDLALAQRLAGLISLDEEAELMAAAHATRTAVVAAANAKLTEVLGR